ncbi:MAG TPA: hypothetical protein VKF81_13290 [Blastocatellia bacterium]|nr:hypothetical protein [Blastocatellia bacterium]
MERWIKSAVASLAMAAVLFASSVSAQEVNRSITLRRDAKLGQQTLTKGDYSVKYTEGKGELVVLRDKREVLTATYELAKLDKPAADNAVIYSQNNDGSFQLKRIEFRGSASALVFENTIAKAITK